MVPLVLAGTILRLSKEKVSVYYDETQAYLEERGHQLDCVFVTSVS